MKRGEIGYTIVISPMEKIATLKKIKITNIDLDTFEGELLEGDYKGWRVTQNKRRFWKTKKVFKEMLGE